LHKLKWIFIEVSDMKTIQKIWAIDPHTKLKKWSWCARSLRWSSLPEEKLKQIERQLPELQVLVQRKGEKCPYNPEPYNILI